MVRPNVDAGHIDAQHGFYKAKSERRREVHAESHDSLPRMRVASKTAARRVRGRASGPPDDRPGRWRLTGSAVCGSGDYGLIGRASRQCRVVTSVVLVAALLSTLLCLARLAAPARCRRRVRHRARLRLQAAELHGRARTGRLRAHLDRHCKRACSPPISPSCSALPTGRWLACAQLPACLHRVSRGSASSMWVSLLCALIEAVASSW